MNEKSSTPIFPSVERPWLRHYSPEAVSMEIPERTLFRFIEEKNRDYPDSVVYRYYGNAITYGTLFQEIRRAARALKKAGVKAGDLVTIQSMHTPETIYLYYAVNYLGAVANMVYVTLPPAEVRQGQAMTGSQVYFIMDKAVQAVMAAGLPEDVTVVTLPVSDSMAEPVRTAWFARSGMRSSGASSQAANSCSSAATSTKRTRTGSGHSARKRFRSCWSVTISAAGPAPQRASAGSSIMSANTARARRKTN